MRLDNFYRRASCLGLAAFVLSISSFAYAQSADADKITAFVPDGEIKTIDIEDRRGLDGILSVNGNINMVQNDSVVGQVDGFSLLFGLGITGGLDWINGRHEFRNTLSIDQSWARTPALQEFIKNNDEIALENIYNYFFLDWSGFFGRFNVQSALLPTEDVRSEPVTYSVTRENGTVDTLPDLRRLELSSSFEPLSLYQSTGLFAEPVQERTISVSFRLGIGARETFASGVLVLDDDDETAEIETKELSNVYQGGGETFLGLRGKAYEDRLSYEVGGSVLMPFLNNDEENRSAVELTRYAVTGAVNFSVLSWLGLSYKLKVISDPQLVDEVQVQNNLLLSFSYTFIDRSDPPAPDPTEVKLEQAREEAEAAEKRAAEAEERASEAEKRAAEAEAAAKAAAEADEEATPVPAPEVEPEPVPEVEGDGGGDGTGGDAEQGN